MFNVLLITRADLRSGSKNKTTPSADDLRDRFAYTQARNVLFVDQNGKVTVMKDRDGVATNLREYFQ